MENTKKLGTGPPPLGWPEEVSWDTFEGVGISGFSNEIMTSIILSMLAAAEIDPNTLVVPQEEVGEHVGLPPVELEQVADQVPAPAEIETPAEQVIVQQDDHD